MHRLYIPATAWCKYQVQQMKVQGHVNEVYPNFYRPITTYAREELISLEKMGHLHIERGN